MKASIIIANFNNAKFIPECINSIQNQTYKNYEIILFDDNSSDDSIQVAKKFDNVQIIENKKQSKYGSLNQINAFSKALEASNGDIIFFLDSDDYFHKYKLEKIIKLFDQEKDQNIIFDYPIVVNKDKIFIEKKKIKIFKSYWGFIHPTSCISSRRDFAKKILDTVSANDFTDIWMDLRTLIFSKYVATNYFTINENLTYYRQTDYNISSKFRKFSKNWWKRRSQAHDYVLSFSEKNNIKIKKNLDYFITKLISYMI